eukprot:2972158-Lingulodinium_polyedra.AAC.1
MLSLPGSTKLRSWEGHGPWWKWSLGDLRRIGGSPRRCSAWWAGAIGQGGDMNDRDIARAGRKLWC